MKKHVVITAEKPSYFHACAPLLAPRIKSLASGDIHPAVNVCYIHPYNAQRFLYPQGLKWKDYPYVGNIAWTLDNGHFKPSAPETDALQSFDTGPAEIDFHLYHPPAVALQNADVIISLSGYDPAGQYTIRTVLDRHASGSAQILIPMIHSLRQPDLAKALDDLTDPDKVVHSETEGKRLAHTGAIKRRFDFLFQVNSLAILSHTFATALGRPTVVPLSKYAIQLLYRMNEIEPSTENALLHLMQSKWQTLAPSGGLPSEPYDIGLGSPASRSSIIQQCLANGLAEHSDDKKLISISDSGHRFLSALHQDCRDYDLPYRIRKWGNDDNAKAKVDRYIRTFFDKQKRYVNQCPR